MTIRRFTTSDGREGAQFSDGWTIAREPGTPGADLATSAEALCDDGTQITWLDAEPAPPAELTEARCPSCDHLTEGHTAAGCWYVIDDHSPSVDGICPCTRVHKPAATPKES